MEFVEPDWPAPVCVRALTTTRCGGVSQGPYASLNLGDHVGDDSAHVAQNRLLLKEYLGLPAEPGWLRQVHGRCVAHIGPGRRKECTADAAFAVREGEVCVVMTADCLPLLVCDRQGSRVAAIHAGWRGLAEGVIEAAVARLDAPARDLLCWLGPAIGPQAFEVGPEVRARFLAQQGAAAGSAFSEASLGKWRADLYLLACQRLRLCGVDKVWGGDWCTYSDRRRFFSYRRDGVTGRMASLIWIQPKNSLR